MSTTQVSSDAANGAPRPTGVALQELTDRLPGRV